MYRSYIEFIPKEERRKAYHQINLCKQNVGIFFVFIFRINLFYCFLNFQRKKLENNINPYIKEKEEVKICK